MRLEQKDVSFTCEKSRTHNRSLISGAGLQDPRVLSKALSGFRLSKCKVDDKSFVQSTEEQLELIAYDFLRNHGRQYWDGQEPRYPVYSEHHNGIWEKVVAILKKQKRHKADILKSRTVDADDSETNDDDAELEVHSDFKPWTARCASGEPRPVDRARLDRSLGTSTTRTSTRPRFKALTQPTRHTTDHNQGGWTSTDAGPITPQSFSRKIETYDLTLDDDVKVVSTHRQLLTQPTPWTALSADGQTDEMACPKRPFVSDFSDEVTLEIDHDKVPQLLLGFMKVMQQKRLNALLKKYQATTDVDRIEAQKEMSLFKQVFDDFMKESMQLGSRVVAPLS